MEKLKEIIIRMLDEAPDKINFFNEIRQIDVYKRQLMENTKMNIIRRYHALCMES